MNVTEDQVARIGLDVLDCGELRHLITRPWFLRFGFAPEELARAETLSAHRRLEYLAGRFAAKEAVLKVLGAGLLQGVAPREICVDRTEHGAPIVRFRGRAARLGHSSVSVSITHKQNVVAAVAMSLPPPAGADAAGGRTDRQELATMSPSPSYTTDTGNKITVGEETPETTAFLRLRIGQEDAHYGGDLVDGARILRLFGDLVTEITIRTDGDEGLLSEYTDLRFTAPVKPGDYIEARGRLVRRSRLRRVVELRAHKVLSAQAGTGESAAAVLDEPQLVCTATATTVVPYRRADAATVPTPLAKET